MRYSKTRILHCEFHVSHKFKFAMIMITSVHHEYCMFVIVDSNSDRSETSVLPVGGLPAQWYTFEAVNIMDYYILLPLKRNYQVLEVHNFKHKLKWFRDSHVVWFPYQKQLLGYGWVVPPYGHPTLWSNISHPTEHLRSGPWQLRFRFGVVEQTSGAMSCFSLGTVGFCRRGLPVGNHGRTWLRGSLWTRVTSKIPNFPIDNSPLVAVS